MKFKEFLNEASLSRVYRQSQEHDIGIMTAFRYAPTCGKGEPYTKKENRARNKELLQKLKAMKYSVISVKGQYIENYGSPDAREQGEESFLVVDINDKGKLKADLVKLGALYEQDSILYIPKGGNEGQLIGTNKCPNGYPGWGKVVRLKNAVFGEKGEFFTRVKGRPFVMKENTEGETK